MRKYEIKTVETRLLISLKCDICGMDIINSPLEEQEAILIADIGGYSSVFGDGCEYQLDMCQHCFKEKLGQYVRIL
jgi:antitoxin CcdA